MSQFIKAASIGLTLFLVGCASTPDPSPDLLAAQQAYEAAKSNPDVLRYAPDQLKEAEQALQRANTAEELADMNSLAYVANAKVYTAQAVTSQRLAEARIVELNKVRDRLRLEVRESELASTREQLAELQAKQTSRGAVVTLGSVLFATGRSELLPGAQASVDRLAKFLAEHPEKTALVEGHTDNTGSDITNLRLSQDRADAVRSALITRGIDAQRITATGLASSQPIAPNSTAAGRQQNRRVEIVIQN